MSKRKPTWDVLSDKRREEAIASVIRYFECERDEKIGMFVAEEIVELVQEHVVWDAYNLGVADSKKLIEDKFADINFDLELLRRN